MSKRYMWLPSSIWLLLFTTCLGAQPTSANKTEAAIHYAKKLLVSSLDSNLPKVSLEFFLSSESQGAAIKWRTNSCGKQTGDPLTDDGRDLPMCVEAHTDLKDGRTLTVVIAVGTFKKGPIGTPELSSASITDQSRLVHPVRRLSDLPMELHRPQRKQPRDLSPQKTAKVYGGCWRNIAISPTTVPRTPVF